MNILIGSLLEDELCAEPAILHDGGNLSGEGPENDWIHEIPHPESSPRFFMGDQNASHIEIRNDLARSVVVDVQLCRKISKATMGSEDGE